MAGSRSRGDRTGQLGGRHAGALPAERAAHAHGGLPRHGLGDDLALRLAAQLELRDGVTQLHHLCRGESQHDDVGVGGRVAERPVHDARRVLLDDLHLADVVRRRPTPIRTARRRRRRRRSPRAGRTREPTGPRSSSRGPQARSRRWRRRPPSRTRSSQGRGPICRPASARSSACEFGGRPASPLWVKVMAIG